MVGNLNPETDVNSQIDKKIIKEFRSLVTCLRPNSPLRELAEKIVQVNSLQDDEFSAVMTILHDARDSMWKERAVAAWLLGEGCLRAEQKTQSAAVLSKILEDRQADTGRRFLRRIGRAGGYFLLFGSVFAGSCALIAYLNSTRTVPNVCAVLILIVSFVLSGYSFPMCLITPIRSLIRDKQETFCIQVISAFTLGRLKLPESIEVIAKASIHSDSRMRWYACRALLNLLPLLRADHYGQLHLETVPHLCKSLEFYIRTLPVCLTILGALEKIGDGRAIKSVEYVSKKSAFSTVQEAARNLLPILYERQRLEHAPQTLMRASQLPDTTPSELLRSAQENNEESAQLLLRPGQSE